MTIKELRAFAERQLEIANEFRPFSDENFARGYREAMIRIIRKIDSKKDNTDG